MNPSARLLLLGTSHHTAPLEIRERLAVAPERIGAFYEGMRRVRGVREALLLSTCNRFEVYGVVENNAQEHGLADFICEFHRFPHEEFVQRRFLIENTDAVQHLLEVAAGVDSQIVGETEIFGQVKTAYSLACSSGVSGPVLNRVCQKVFQAAKLIRSTTPIGEGQVGISTVAVELAGKIFGHLSASRILVIGTGEIGDKTMRAFHGRGAAAITVLSRTQARADVLAATVGGRAGTLDQVATLLPDHDIVIGCTSASAPVVTAKMVQSTLRDRRLRPLFLIDLGLPRNFEAGTGELESVFLYDLDDLVRIADENLAARRAAIARCRQLAQEKSLRIWEGVAPRLGGTLNGAPAERLAPREQPT